MHWIWYVFPTANFSGTKPFILNYPNDFKFFLMEEKLVINLIRGCLIILQICIEDKKSLYYVLDRDDVKFLDCLFGFYLYCFENNNKLYLFFEQIFILSYYNPENDIDKYYNKYKVYLTRSDPETSPDNEYDLFNMLKQYINGDEYNKLFEIACSFINKIIKTNNKIPLDNKYNLVYIKNNYKDTDNNIYGFLSNNEEFDNCSNFFYFNYKKNLYLLCEKEIDLCNKINKKIIINKDNYNFKEKTDKKINTKYCFKEINYYDMLIICYNYTNLHAGKKEYINLLNYIKSYLPTNFKIYNTIHTIDKIDNVNSKMMTYNGLFPKYLNDINETKKYNTICFFL